MANLEGKKAPAFILEGSDGKKHSLADYAGKPWCFIFIRGTTHPDARRKPAAFVTWGRP
jgi:thioredoxin-dependent peroxiredoxin